MPSTPNLNTVVLLLLIALMSIVTPCVAEPIFEDLSIWFEHRELTYPNPLYECTIYGEHSIYIHWASPHEEFCYYLIYVDDVVVGTLDKNTTSMFMVACSGGFSDPDGCDPYAKFRAYVNDFLLNNFYNHTYKVEAVRSCYGSLPPIFDEVYVEEPTGNPAISFTHFPEKPMVGGNIIFDVDTSVGGAEPVSYHWNWGDGISETIMTNRVSHLFDHPQGYTITLTVSYDDGSTSSEHMNLDLSIELGDILLSRSDMSFVPADEWTHVGMYVGNEQVVELMLSDGVIVSPLSKWSWKEGMTYVRALRVKTDVNTREKAVNFALGKKGESYDTRKIFLQWLRLRDKEVNSNSSYCSEFIWAAYKKASNGTINLDQSRWGNVVSPDEIDSDDDVELIGEHKEEKPETLWRLDRIWGGVAYCPVDLIIHNPDGLVLGKDANEIPGAIYEEIDIDEDGEIDDFFVFPNCKIGDYEISVVAESNALPNDIYSLQVIVDDKTIILAQDTTISDIPQNGYSATISEKSDLNNDEKVNFLDFVTLVTYWLRSNCEESNNWCNAADIDTSRTVDMLDLSSFVSHWLEDTTP